MRYAENRAVGKDDDLSLLERAGSGGHRLRRGVEGHRQSDQTRQGLCFLFCLYPCPIGGLSPHEQTERND